MTPARHLYAGRLACSHLPLRRPEALRACREGSKTEQVQKWIRGVLGKQPQEQEDGKASQPLLDVQLQVRWRGRRAGLGNGTRSAWPRPARSGRCALQAVGRWAWVTQLRLGAQEDTDTAEEDAAAKEASSPGCALAWDPRACSAVPNIPVQLAVERAPLCWQHCSGEGLAAAGMQLLPHVHSSVHSHVSTVCKTGRASHTSFQVMRCGCGCRGAGQDGADPDGHLNHDTDVPFLSLKKREEGDKGSLAHVKVGHPASRSATPAPV